MKLRRKRKGFSSGCLILTAILVLCIFGRAPFARADENYGADAYYYVSYLETNYPERAVANPNLDAASAWLKSQITNMGYEYGSQPFSVPLGEYVINGENIYFSKRGESDRVIVVGAHYDSVLTRGTDDNASGVGVLLETAARVSAGGMYPFTIRFVLFSAEEPGCVGSKYYVEQLSAEERARILCMINLDTIGAGDYMYLYGGSAENGTIVRTWVVEQALEAAESLGLAMSTHPDVNPEFPAPSKQTASDQEAFNAAGIPYLYCEASNWNGGPMTNFYQTDNPAVADGKMMHVAAYESLAFYNQTFGNRFREHLAAYAELLDWLLNNLVPDSGTAGLSFEERSETVRAVSDVRIRRSPSTGAEVLDVLKSGEEILRVGYSESWSRVSRGDQTGYIKTEFLEPQEPTSEALETEPAETDSAAEEPEDLTDEDESALTEPESGDLSETGLSGTDPEKEQSSAADTAEEETAEEKSKSVPETTYPGEPETVVLTAAPSAPDRSGPSGNALVDHAVSEVKDTADTLTNSVRKVFSGFSPESFSETIRREPALAAALIVGIILLAVILCLVVYLIRLRSGKK